MSFTAKGNSFFKESESVNGFEEQGWDLGSE